VRVRVSLEARHAKIDEPLLSVDLSYLIEWQEPRVDLRELAKNVGGHATLFRTSAAHADVDKAAGVNTPLDAVQQRIQQQLQKQFDPKGVFATGRMHPHTSAI
jgi:glycolate oxidase FAD binding subunit